MAELEKTPENGTKRNLTGAAAELAEELQRLRAAMDLAGERADPFLVDRARREIESIQERVNAGMGITVAALAGGTGSGKSTLFNALTGLHFADPGDIRPTTMDISACTWSADAPELLDILGVDPRRTIAYDSILAPDDHGISSLILLDLPDHDSVAASNTAKVDRVLPMVDLLIWVLDPQKYADNLIHDAYISAMKNRRERMIVLLNQADTIPQGRVADVVEDVRRLLAAEGMEEVPVYATSGKERIGLEPVWEELRTASQSTDSALETARAELDAVRARLAQGYETPAVNPRGQEIEELTDDLYSSSGISAVTAALADPSSRAIPRPEQPSLASMTAARESWLAFVRSGLPGRWANALDEEIPEPEHIRRALGVAVRAVPGRRRGSTGAWVCGILGLLILVLGIVLPLVGAVAFPLWAGITVGVLGAGVSIACAWLLKRKAARGAARTYDAAMRESISQAVEKEFTLPAAKVLDDYTQTRQLLTD